MVELTGPPLGASLACQVDQLVAPRLSKKSHWRARRERGEATYVALAGTAPTPAGRSEREAIGKSDAELLVGEPMRSRPSAGPARSNCYIY
jgi:hypothetical protein